MPDPKVEGIGLLVGAVSGFVPAIAPFQPLIMLVTTAIVAHYNATKTWPTPEEVAAALPADLTQLHDTWAAWKPSGDGTLPGSAPVAAKAGLAAPLSGGKPGL